MCVGGLCAKRIELTGDLESLGNANPGQPVDGGDFLLGFKPALKWWLGVHKWALTQEHSWVLPINMVRGLLRQHLTPFLCDLVTASSLLWYRYTMFPQKLSVKQ